MLGICDLNRATVKSDLTRSLVACDFGTNGSLEGLSQMVWTVGVNASVTGTVLHALYSFIAGASSDLLNQPVDGVNNYTLTGASVHSGGGGSGYAVNDILELTGGMVGTPGVGGPYITVKVTGTGALGAVTSVSIDVASGNYNPTNLTTGGGGVTTTSSPGSGCTLDCTASTSDITRVKWVYNNNSGSGSGNLYNVSSAEGDYVVVAQMDGSVSPNPTYSFNNPLGGSVKAWDNNIYGLSAMEFAFLGRQAVFTGASSSVFNWTVVNSSLKLIAPGTNYHSGDFIAIGGSSPPAAVAIEVDTVDGSGRILTWHVDTTHYAGSEAASSPLCYGSFVGGRPTSPYAVGNIISPIDSHVGTGTGATFGFWPLIVGFYVANTSSQTTGVTRTRIRYFGRCTVSYVTVEYAAGATVTDHFRQTGSGTLNYGDELECPEPSLLASLPYMRGTGEVITAMSTGILLTQSLSDYVTQQNAIAGSTIYDIITSW